MDSSDQTYSSVYIEHPGRDTATRVKADIVAIEPEIGYMGDVSILSYLTSVNIYCLDCGKSTIISNVATPLNNKRKPDPKCCPMCGSEDFILS